MRKQVLVFLVIALAAMGAGARPLEVWLTGHSNEELAIISDVIEEFFTAQTGIQVELTGLSWADNETRFLLAAASGDAPDVGGSGALLAPDLGLRGAVVDLRQIIPEIQQIQAQSFPGLYRSLQFEQAIFGVPYSISVFPAYIRRDLFDEAGLEVPRTWGEMENALLRLASRNASMSLTYGLQDTVYQDINLFMWQSGGDDYTPDLSRSGLDTPQSLAGFRQYAALYTEYKIPLEIPVMQGFRDGRLALTIQGLHFYNQLVYSAPELRGQWEMSLVPGTLRDGRIDHMTTATSLALFVFSSSTRKSEAAQFVQWLASPQPQLEISRRISLAIPGAFFLPTWREAIASIDLPEKDRAVLVSQLDQGQASLFGLVAPRSRRRYFLFAAQRVLMQGWDPDEAMRAAAVEHNQELERKKTEYHRFILRLRDR